MSSFHNKQNIGILNSKITTYSFSLGMDYLEKNWFYLSSQIGYMKVGGEETNPRLPDEYKYISESGSFIHLNTSFRAYLKSSELKFFVGLGPYINVLVSDGNFDGPEYNQGFTFQKLYAGGRPEIGVTADINKFRAGLVGSYILSLSPSASSEFISLYNNGLSIMATIAYRIK